MKHCVFLILMHQSSKLYLSLRKATPSLLKSGNCWQLTAVCVNWRHPFRHTPLEKYPSCILLLLYNLASVNYVPIRNHTKKGLAKEKIIAKWRKDRCPSQWFVLVCQNDRQDKMGKDVSSQSNFNPKLLIDIYLRILPDSAFCWWDLVEDGLVVVVIPIIGTLSV